MSTQRAVFDWLKAQTGMHGVHEIAQGTGLGVKETGNACQNLKKKGAISSEGTGVNMVYFTVIDEITIGNRGGSRQRDPNDSRTPGAKKGTVALRRFEKSVEELLDAWVEAKDYFVPEDLKVELDELRAFKQQVMQAQAMLRRK